MSQRFATELAQVTFLNYHLDTQPREHSIKNSEGETIYTYHIGGILGEGCYGKVKIGIEASTGQVVAIKTLHPQLQVAQSAFEQDLLRSEYLAFARANSLEESSTCYYENGTMVMPFIAGEEISPGDTVAQWLKTCERLIKQIETLHDEGITHGDLHYNNIRITTKKSADQESADREITLLDFGLSIVQGGAESSEEKEIDLSLNDSQIKDYIKEFFIKEICQTGKDRFHSEVKKHLHSFFFNSKKLIRKRVGPFVSFLKQDPSKAKDLINVINSYIIKCKNKNFSALETCKILTPILQKIIHQHLPHVHLKILDIAYIEIFLERLISIIENHIYLFRPHMPIDLLEKLTCESRKLNDVISNELATQDLKKSHEQMCKIQANLKELIINHIDEQLNNGKSYKLLENIDSFIFLLSFLPSQEKLDILDRIYGQIDKSKTSLKKDMILKLYFIEFHEIIKNLDTVQRDKKILSMTNNHEIPKTHIKRFKAEVNKTFAPTVQIKRFIDNPTENILLDFLRNCQRFYHDRSQLQKQVRQAMIIIFHLFASDFDEKSNDTPQDQALAKLSRLVWVEENKDARDSIFQVFLWIKKSIELNDLNDVEASLEELTGNKKFMEFKEKEEKETVTKSENQEQETFRTKAIDRVKERIRQVKETASRFKADKTSNKPNCLDAIQAHLELDEFTSLGEFLNPKTLKVHYPNLFNPREPRFPFWGGKSNPESTSTYKMFEELSARYDEILRETPSLTCSSPR